jgi:hypothetical protein
MKHHAKMLDDRPLDARELTLIEQVDAALAEYRGEQPSAKHRSMALAMLKRSVLREASRPQPDIDSLVG